MAEDEKSADVKVEDNGGETETQTLPDGETAEDNKPLSPPDWLPVGWTMDLKFKTTGQKYKIYTDPSKKLKFYSKPQVVRFLNNKEIYHPPGYKKKKKKGTKKHSATEFAVEKVEAEGLPPGWTKEMKVSKKGRKIRKDPYYTDPVSGYTFRSRKDVLRYLETGELGKLAIKPKDKGQVKAESTAEAEGQKVEDTGTNGLPGNIA